MRVCRDGVVCCSPSRRTILAGDAHASMYVYIYFVICAPVASCDFEFSDSITLPIYIVVGTRLTVKILFL